jgi:hypothetical protein
MTAMKTATARRLRALGDELPAFSQARLDNLAEYLLGEWDGIRRPESLEMCAAVLSRLSTLLAQPKGHPANALATLAPSDHDAVGWIAVAMQSLADGATLAALEASALDNHALAAAAKLFNNIAADDEDEFDLFDDDFVPMDGDDEEPFPA